MNACVSVLRFFVNVTNASMSIVAVVMCGGEPALKVQEHIIWTLNLQLSFPLCAGKLMCHGVVVTGLSQCLPMGVAIGMIYFFTHQVAAQGFGLLLTLSSSALIVCLLCSEVCPFHNSACLS